MGRAAKHLPAPPAVGKEKRAGASKAAGAAGNKTCGEARARQGAASAPERKGEVEEPRRCGRAACSCRGAAETDGGKMTSEPRRVCYIITVERRETRTVATKTRHCIEEKPTQVKD